MVVLRLPLVSFVTWQLKAAYEGDTTFFGGFVRAQVRCTSSFYRCSFFISGWSLKKLWSPVASSQCIFVNHEFALDLFEKYENSHVLQSFSSQASTHVCGQYDSGIFGNLAFLWPEKRCSFVTHCPLVMHRKLLVYLRTIYTRPHVPGHMTFYDTCSPSSVNSPRSPYH